MIQKLIEILDVLKKYKDQNSEISFGRKIVFFGISPKQISEDDLEILEELGVNIGENDICLFEEDMQ